MTENNKDDQAKTPKIQNSGISGAFAPTEIALSSLTAKCREQQRIEVRRQELERIRKLREIDPSYLVGYMPLLDVTGNPVKIKRMATIPADTVDRLQNLKVDLPAAKAALENMVRQSTGPNAFIPEMTEAQREAAIKAFEEYMTSPKASPTIFGHMGGLGRFTGPLDLAPGEVQLAPLTKCVAGQKQIEELEEYDKLNPKIGVSTALDIPTSPPAIFATGSHARIESSDHQGAYEAAVAGGFKGTKDQWLHSTKNDRPFAADFDGDLVANGPLPPTIPVVVVDSLTEFETVQGQEKAYVVCTDPLVAKKLVDDGLMDHQRTFAGGLKRGEVIVLSYPSQISKTLGPIKISPRVESSKYSLKHFIRDEIDNVDINNVSYNAMINRLLSSDHQGDSVQLLPTAKKPAKNKPWYQQGKSKRRF